MMKLHTLTTLLHAPALPDENKSCTGISIDSRTLQTGNLFIAIRGERFDGHAYLDEVAQKGACAAVVDHTIDNAPLPLIVVPHTVQALSCLAQAWRRQFSLPFVALTGSCGKTTTKTLLAHILAQQGATLSTQGTLNNEIGVPLTLLQLRAEHRFAVIELGANHPREIHSLAHLVEPDIAVVTNVAPVHLEGFGTLEGVARTKSELYEALPSKGIAILNHDDAFFPFFKKQTAHCKTLSFGFHHNADVRASELGINARGFPTFTLHYRQEICRITLPLLGQHNVMNALAAAGAALALQIPLSVVKTGLETAQAVNKRMNKHLTFNDAVLIDDTYNANPVAFAAAMDFLIQQAGRKILVAGDMGELGHDAAHYHEKLGKQAKQKGIHHLFTVGKLSSHATKAFGENAKHFETKAALIHHLRHFITPDQIVLVKGSRSAKMEEVIEALKK
ncbi:MAG: UDP-N-acetylmuramoyl-tripeptide--D-alanyl-D-alanine ligase [Gammaproteobacteria bacterium]|nr:UDP-N-acetylmuramoyl-tripeptide--D-alanyl-D-alanine ligase [Gammaproteobacteria bacterium]